MNQLKSVLISVLIILALAGIYYGAFLPWEKAQLYVAINRVSSTFRTVDELTHAYEKVFNFYSPIGDEEVIKFTIDNILQIISQASQSEQVSKALVEYIEPYTFKDDAIHLLHMAYLYDVLWQRFGRDIYFEKTESYYNQVRDIGPRLPHTLYGLFNLYQRKGDDLKMKAVGEEILRHWPNDMRVMELLNLKENEGGD